MKAQISQVFVYIMTAIVITAVLGFGVKYLFKLMDDVDQAKCIEFKDDLKERIEENKGYGTLDTAKMRVECDYQTICFISDMHSDHYDESSYEYSSSDPFLQDVWESHTKLNVFFKNPNSYYEEMYYVPDLMVTNGKKCLDVQGGMVDLSFEGKGGFTLLDSNFEAQNNDES